MIKVPGGSYGSYRLKTSSIEVLESRGNVLFVNHCNLKRCSGIIAMCIDRYRNSEGVALPGYRITRVVELYVGFLVRRKKCTVARANIVIRLTT